MPSIQELNENLQKVNQLLIRTNNLYEYAFNRLEVGALWYGFLRWYEECFEFLVAQNEELSEILNRQNNELFDDIFFKKIYLYLFFFLEKMEAIIKKISSASDKIDIMELYSVGEKIHHVINKCNQNCACVQYLTDLKKLIDTINTSDVPTNQKIIFEETSLKNSNSLLLYDQINKKFGSEIFIMNENILKSAVNFEFKKIKRYLKAIETMVKLEWCIYIFSKGFI